MKQGFHGNHQIGDHAADCQCGGRQEVSSCSGQANSRSPENAPFGKPPGKVGQETEQIVGPQKIPTGADEESVAPIALIGLTKVGEEQGEWAANTALSILDGASPADIPIVTNKRGRLFINMALGKQIGAVFKVDLLKEATILE